MNDWSYSCLAKALADGIVDATTGSKRRLSDQNHMAD